MSSKNKIIIQNFYNYLKIKLNLRHIFNCKVIRKYQLIFKLKCMQQFFQLQEIFIAR